MTKIRYLSMAMVLLVSIFAHGQGTFNPTSPIEPGAPTIYSRIMVVADPAEGGSVYGGGKYAVGASQRIQASVNSGYRLAYWSDAEGNVLSTATSFYFTNTENLDVLTAHFEFIPSSPNEPVTPSATLYYQLKVQSTEGGSVSGGGKYQAGNVVKLSAYNETGYDFVNWTNQDGEIVSTSSTFNYTTREQKDTLTAKFRFNPAGPGEPDEPVVRHKVNVRCSEGGTFSGTSGMVLTGNTATLYAYTNSGYEFMGWYLNGEFYTALPNFSYTMGVEDVDFYALFRFNPASPSEPLMPALDKYSYYLMTINGSPGKTIEYPLYMANSVEARDMTFQLTFPSALMPRLDEVGLSELATGYTTSATAINDTVYVFSMIGGTLPAATTKLLTFYVDIPAEISTGFSRQVKINQISVMEEDGTTVTAHTRNGRMGVYKMGDVNGDDQVNITDVVGTLNLIKDTADESLIKEVADPNEDGEINITDVVGIIEIIKENSNEE